MREIKVLDQITIDKIAAGEVVERPSSVVKELVENAIDAGADSVTVEIRDGGISFIRITDNGCGIEKEQVPVAFLRHATSKISQAEDLTHIISLGFRGEALSSIAAVSQMELITKTPDAMTGTRYVIEGGIEKSYEDIGAPDGTTFLVRNLFFNTPARAKFLKAPGTEGSYVSTTMEQLALSNPKVAFKFVVNGQTKLATSGSGQMKDVIYNIYGREIARELMEVDWESEGISVKGYVARPTVSRGNRHYENYYVNGRSVKNRIATKAIEDAYHSYMMQHKYPFTALSIQIKQNIVDVNVHPTKKEVRFSDEPRVYNAVYEAVTKALKGKELIPQVPLEKTQTVKPKPIPASAVPEPFETRRRVQESVQTQEHTSSQQRSVLQETLPAQPMEKQAEAQQHMSSKTQSTSSNDDNEKKQEIEQEILQQETEQTQVAANPAPSMIQETPVVYAQQEMTRELLKEENRSMHRLIGQLFDTYWLVEFDQRLFLIDQHAAHEKVLYERILKEYQVKQITSQVVSPPIVVSLNMEEETALLDYMEDFQKLGFVIEAFGGKEYAIREVPYNLYSLNAKDLFLEVLDHLGQEGSRIPPHMVTDRLATMACKAAVKGNHKLSLAEADALIGELLTLDNPYQCPHGRPTIISMSKYELERKFKRIV